MQRFPGVLNLFSACIVVITVGLFGPSDSCSVRYIMFLKDCSPSSHIRIDCLLPHALATISWIIWGPWNMQSTQQCHRLSIYPSEAIPQIRLVISPQCEFWSSCCCLLSIGVRIVL